LEFLRNRSDYIRSNTWSDEKGELVLFQKLSSGGNVFYFREGGIVCWNCAENESQIGIHLPNDQYSSNSSLQQTQLFFGGDHHCTHHCRNLL